MSGRPTTEASLKKLGFTVLEFDRETYWARVEYKGAVTAMRGDSAKELLAIAKGWLDHVEG